MSIRVVSNLRKVQAKIEAGRKRNQAAGALAWQKAMVKILTGGRSGRFYKVPGTSKFYQASSKHEPPASATGRLRSSIAFQEDGNSYIVGTPVIYALYLERGTKTMRPRKFMMPAFEKARSEIERAMKNRII